MVPLLVVAFLAPTAAWAATKKAAATPKTTPGTAGRAAATAPANAAEWFAEGNARYARRDYLGAADAFKEAYRLDHHPGYLYNMGLTYRLGGEYADALYYFELFLADEPALREERGRTLRAEVEGKIAELRVLARADRPPEASGAAPAAAAAAGADTPPTLLPFDPIPGPDTAAAVPGRTAAAAPAAATEPTAVTPPGRHPRRALAIGLGAGAGLLAAATAVVLIAVLGARDPIDRAAADFPADRVVDQRDVEY